MGFISFRDMVSTALIKLLYILGVIISILGCVSAVLFPKGYLSNWFTTISAMIIFNLIWRILCEFLIMPFSVHDILSSIEKRMIMLEETTKK
ncbi:DUF4282 domain-containing protein [Candidatus Magnetominusculus dajiuhuensis]|uniref:DUF4282 domain-containing protein n=1 Tax=Candidatus Magnetominusculus dajiuhuensis TaxID=3137712 RepID=UPI003B43B370